TQAAERPASAGRKPGMLDTHKILSKIAALRQKLDVAKVPAGVALPQPAAPPEEPMAPPERVHRLARHSAAGAQHNTLINRTAKQVPGLPAARGEGAALPAQLTARAARLLRRARELLAELRGLTDEPQLRREETEPLAVMYRETVAMTDLVLRTLQT